MPPSWTKWDPRSTTPVCFSPITPACLWQMVLALQIVANVLFVNSTPLSVQKAFDGVPYVVQ